MIKDLWQECNVIQKIAMIFYGLLLIASHVLVIYGLLDVEWAASGVLPAILTRILLIVMFALCISFDTIMIIVGFIDKD